MSWLRNAFAIDPPGPTTPTADEEPVIARIVDAIVRRGLATPALLFLESSQPLNFIAAQFLVFIGPLARVVINGPAYNAFTAFLERRGSVETLCRRIEAAQAQRDTARETERRAAANPPGASADTGGASDTKAPRGDER